MTRNRITNVSIFSALIAAAAIAGARQGDVQAQTTTAPTICTTGGGENALTIALTSAAPNHITGVYIRRKGCDQWSKNLGVVLPGKSIHLFNLDDGDFDVFWREHVHTYGASPALVDNPPTTREWNKTQLKRTVSLRGETHRRIVLP